MLTQAMAGSLLHRPSHSMIDPESEYQNWGGFVSAQSEKASLFKGQEKKAYSKKKKLFLNSSFTLN